jgi:NAD(P)-dependent dehydrogenase (short-subunit alcohol dehydrogenase family)
MSGQTPPVAVITGASQGIGASLVSACRDRGYAVLATSRTVGPWSDPILASVQGDIAAPDTAERVMDEATERFGRVDTLVNNAGYTDGDYDLVTGVNLDGFFYITRRAIAYMAERARGHVVNLTTTLVEHANLSFPSALASLTKGGVAAVTKSLAPECAAAGIRVNALSPGVNKTPVHAPEAYEALGGLHPMGRMGDVSDIVPAVMYLESATFVTGEFLDVDGGQSASH